ncbi:uncharacterized protein LACBIDRAFT_301450 [Laccaria bicolor S238N-H82]|uniref:Predicted protein n=1 Tax=Laccaria bicolor (strain S238N-H82 / ATCC MYA-4686) TaxID=486041 RepID=B0CNK2_LACBS|nr:uncharacterized protein LACBIDRAFT_301450 [Laccaria bicolor S238N-H82]EDR15324.1 predicted protein [Laccaria bicolor S238N-H82]|eukprot:XP_001873532.1 predicted protein [Laccaria bicolor S238N-H82]
MVLLPVGLSILILVNLPTRLSSQVYQRFFLGHRQVQDIDVVLSYYRENVTTVAQGIQALREQLGSRGFSSKIIVYSKDESLPVNNSLQTLLGADSIIRLSNRGREGGSFLTHILSQYDRAQRYPHEFSSHILFGQAILDVQDIVNSRISVLRKETSFLSLGRYAECDCGRDAHGLKKYFPRMREICAMFTGRLCPSGGQLCTYKGQFIVSSKSILRNPKRLYQDLFDVLTAPEGHWIYDDAGDKEWEWSGSKSSPSSPFFGHALERSWPTIFGCVDVLVSRRCSLSSPESCQCTHDF